MDNTSVSKKSTEDARLQDTVNTQHATSMASVNTLTASLQASRADPGTDITGTNATVAKEEIQASSSAEIHNTASSSSTIVVPPASVAKSSSAQLTASSAFSLPNTMKLEPSTVKLEPRDFDATLFQPMLPTSRISSYNANKVAAEMAKIDSFLASLAKGGISNNPIPNTKIKTEPVGVFKPKPVGSALGNIALSYGHSEEEESSSSSSDESEDDRPGSIGSAKTTTATAVVAMDTQEVEQSMKKVAVSSDSSSSSSEDELG